MSYDVVLSLIKFVYGCSKQNWSGQGQILFVVLELLIKADRDKGPTIHEWEYNIDKSFPTKRIQDVRFPVMTTLSYSEYEAFVKYELIF